VIPKKETFHLPHLLWASKLTTVSIPYIFLYKRFSRATAPCCFLSFSLAPCTCRTSPVGCHACHHLRSLHALLAVDSHNCKDKSTLPRFPPSSAPCTCRTSRRSPRLPSSLPPTCFYLCNASFKGRTLLAVFSFFVCIPHLPHLSWAATLTTVSTRTCSFKSSAMRTTALCRVHLLRPHLAFATLPVGRHAHHRLHPHGRLS